ncbi:hypothetical protein HPB50_006291 [Hyalomma asiaticum]|uniref:Uncharacterized protein n=1 Tax=Hyalomma asiaticum TaxID=266040 RepID=A0ACB7SBH8_HYAAI|nr:hypothetical protein HPB50_006291 [Hyalomma asiaticum]
MDGEAASEAKRPRLEDVETSPAVDESNGPDAKRGFRVQATGCAGTLLFSGGTNWDTIGRRPKDKQKAGGSQERNLWGPHRLAWPHRVKAVFSGCSACHTVLLTEQGQAYTWAKNCDSNGSPRFSSSIAASALVSVVVCDDGADDAVNEYYFARSGKDGEYCGVNLVANVISHAVATSPVRDTSLYKDLYTLAYTGDGVFVVTVYLAPNLARDACCRATGRGYGKCVCVRSKVSDLVVLVGDFNVDVRKKSGEWLVEYMRTKYSMQCASAEVIVGCNLPTTAHHYNDHIIHAHFLVDSKLRLPGIDKFLEVSVAVTKLLSTRPDHTLSVLSASSATVHIASKKHQGCVQDADNQPSLASFVCTDSDFGVIRAECLFTAFLVEHDIPLSVSDHAGPLFWKILPKCEEAKRYACGRTKTIPIVGEMAANTETPLMGALR